MSKEQRYTSTAIFLHWLVGLGLIGTFAVGFYMVDMPFSPSKLQLYSWHKWAGITLLALAIIRLAWRISHPAPELPSSMGRMSQFAAHAGHWLLYVLMITIPISGWLMSSAQGFTVVWFGVVALPNLVTKSTELSALFTTIHVTLNYLLAAAVCGHIGAAFYHHLIKKDSVLTRMLPFCKRT